MSTQNELIAQALIGDEAKKFLESDFGKCLIGMANQEADAALQQLADVDPDDAKAVRKLQNRVWLGRQFEAFVQELITEGNNALATWRQQTDESPD
jgi:ABC-type Zn2+ transport system substrate-binding protein/surface adhesin